MKLSKNSIILTAGLVLSGCGLPVYKQDQSLPTAKLKTAEMSSPQICTNGKAYKLSVSDDKIALLPTGRQIGIASAFYTSDGNMHYSCRPTISFTPQEDVDYIGVLLFRDNTCYLQILREDASTPSGLTWEPSVRRGGC